jgi:hypothetical protein
MLPSERTSCRCAPPRRLRWLRAAAVCGAVFSAILGGCAIDPVRDAERVLAEVPAAALSKARGLEEAGEPAEAAAAYLELAEGAPSPAREQLELDAAAALLSAGEAIEATNVLSDIDKGKLTAAQREQVLLLEADLALQRGRATEALARLQQVNKGRLPTNLKIRYLGTEAAAYRLAGEPMRAAESLNELDGVLRGDRAAQRENQVSLLFTLATLGRAGLDEAIRDTRGRMQGWSELARLFSEYGAPSPRLDAAFRDWRRAHGGHPALADLPEAYFATLAGGYPAGTDALVLLPSGGRFGVAGDAVKNGIQAAYDADRSGSRPNLRFGGGFDAGVDAGADLVIGPLLKSSVADLSARSSLPVPTLALNRTGGGATDNLYQYSLAPEDEADNVANYAKNAGFERAAILYPDDGFGQRLANAFRSRWRTLGGRIATERGYRSRAGSYARDAAALLGGGDADFVFMVATNEDAPRLYGSLRESGVRVPVVATSHVYDGDIDPARDAALAGLYFVDIPWILDTERSDTLSRDALRERLPNVSGPLARLYAMGIDGYRLAPRIEEMSANPGAFFPGETGGLTLDALGQVRRQLLLARFTGAGPKVQSAIEAPPTAGGDVADADVEPESS